MMYKSYTTLKLNVTLVGKYFLHDDAYRVKVTLSTWLPDTSLFVSLKEIQLDL